MALYSEIVKVCYVVASGTKTCFGIAMVEYLYALKYNQFHNQKNCLRQMSKM